jgi:hypothetical protein
LLVTFSLVVACGAPRRPQECDVPLGTIANPTQIKHVFVTTAVATGAFAVNNAGLSALDVADQACAAEAAAAHLTGSFRAWLSTSTTDAISRIESNGPWYSVMGLPGSQTVSRLFDDRAQLTKAMNCLGLYSNASGAVQSSGDIRVWTGTLANGQRSTFTCNDFTTNANSADKATVSLVDDPAHWNIEDTTDAGPPFFEPNSPWTCDASFRFLCLEQ